MSGGHPRGGPSSTTANGTTSGTTTNATTNTTNTTTGAPPPPPRVSDILSPSWLRRSQTQITPGAHLQIVWRGFFSLGMFMDQNNLLDDFDEEGPTTSNALRADSGVSDGNVSLNNTDGEDETGSDATQILSTGAVESKERQRLMRKGGGGASSQQRQHHQHQQERRGSEDDESLRRQRRLHNTTMNASSDETSVENTTTTNSGERGGDVVNTNTNASTREASQTSDMSQGSFEDHQQENTNGGENTNDMNNMNREHSEDTGVTRDTNTSNRDRDNNNNNNNNNNASEQPLFNNATELIARAPPMGFRIPGTAAGEGVARAHAAGNVLPDILRAKRVTSLDAEFPLVWDPVALL